MPGDLQPLAQNFAIVDQNGFPTQYFIKWAQQRQIDITAGITAAQAQELIDTWAASRTLTAGAGLSGGGTLAANRTFDVNAGTGITLAGDAVGLANTAVTPGAYGDATHVGTFTVDAQGRLVAAASVAITVTGGGGNSFSTPPTLMSSVDSGGNATMGNILILKDAITVSALYGSFVNSTIGNVYSMFIATVNTATGAIISTVASTASVTTTATAGQTKKFTFATPVALVAGTCYLFGLVKTSATSTTPCNTMYGSPTSYPNLPMDAGEMVRLWSSALRVAAYASNSASPSAVAAAAGSFASGGTYAVGILFTM